MADGASERTPKKDWTEMDFEQFMSSGAFEKALEAEEGEEAEGLDSDEEGGDEPQDDNEDDLLQVTKTKWKNPSF